MKRLKEALVKVGGKARCIAARLNIAAASLLAGGYMAYAGASATNIDNAKTLAEDALKIIGTVAIIPGIILVAIGAIHYGSAHADGDGPAQAKARNEIVGGIMVTAVGAIMVGAAGTFAGLITDPGI